jgi:DNA-directed RNA polymerase subunit RPC12/RpoP
MEPLESGTLAGAGSFRCEDCGYVVTTQIAQDLPACVRCGGRRFTRASLQLTGSMPALGEPDGEQALAARARAAAAGRTGQLLAFDDAGELRLVPVVREWTRIGRSLAADVRFDDATVSRRHALLVRAPDGVRIVDDRSMNGIFVNGERVEWTILADGDEVAVGRHVLVFLDLVAVPAPAPAPHERTA